MGVKFDYDGIVEGECSWCGKEKPLYVMEIGPGGALVGPQQLCDRCHKKALANSLRKKKAAPTAAPVVNNIAPQPATNTK